MKILILYYSTYGHIDKMARAVAEGAAQVEGAEVMLRRVPETLSREVLEKTGALEPQAAFFKDVPEVTLEELADAAEREGRRVDFRVSVRGDTDDLLDGNESAELKTYPDKFNDTVDEDWFLGLGYRQRSGLASGFV